MSDLVRISISLDSALLERAETLRRARGYENRSEFLRDLLRERLVEEAWETDEEAVGAITLIYDHHQRQLGEKLTEVQHDHHDVVLATTHVHLDRRLCAEVIMTRGRAGTLRRLADTLRRQKGVLHGELTMTSTGKELL